MVVLTLCISAVYERAETFKSRRTSMSDKVPGSPWQKKLMYPLISEILPTFFWDMKGPILEYFKDKGRTVHSATYSAVLKDN
jgi:hypothetical protein